jgi:hypothetical protein
MELLSAAKLLLHFQPTCIRMHIVVVMACPSPLARVQSDGSQGMPSQSLNCVFRVTALHQVRAGREALEAGEPGRAQTLAAAATEASIPACEAAVRLKVEALLAAGRWVMGDLLALAITAIAGSSEQ